MLKGQQWNKIKFEDFISAAIKRNLTQKPMSLNFDPTPHVLEINT